MAVDSATLNAHLEAARVALVAGDYATAEQQAAAAMICLAGIPNVEGPGGKFEFRDTINTLMAQIRIMKSNAAQATAGGVQAVRMVMQDPTD